MNPHEEKQAHVNKFANYDKEQAKKERAEVVADIIKLENIQVKTSRDQKWREGRIAGLYAEKRDLEAVINNL